MIVTIKFPGYNFRRYSKPWIALVTKWPVGHNPDMQFGTFIGTDSEGGFVELEANAGDIIRYGQKDLRGNNTTKTYAVVNDDGTLRPLSTADAAMYWRKNHNEHATA